MTTQPRAPALTETDRRQTTIAFIQARLGSSRLPGKVLEDLAGRTVLERVIQRVQAVRDIDDAVVLTSQATRDDAICSLCAQLGVSTVRGSEDDVLARFATAATLLRPDVIVRITADCPLLDPSIVTRLLATFRQRSVDFAAVAAGEPAGLDLRRFPAGLDAEVLTAPALALAHAEADEPYEREHVTPFIWRRPGRFKVCFLEAPHDMSHLNWSLDDREDLARIRGAYEHMRDPDRDYGFDITLRLLGS